jgi:hypothetical protein
MKGCLLWHKFCIKGVMGMTPEEVYDEKCVKQGLDCVKVYCHIYEKKEIVQLEFNHNVFGAGIYDGQTKEVYTKKKTFSFENIPMDRERYLKHVVVNGTEEWAPVYEYHYLDQFYGMYTATIWGEPTDCATVSDLYNKIKDKMGSSFDLFNCKMLIR